MWFFVAFLANEIKICRRGILKSKRQCFMVHSFPGPAHGPLKRCFRLWDERFTALSISQHWYMDKDAIDAFEGNQECPSEI